MEAAQNWHDISQEIIRDRRLVEEGGGHQFRPAFLLQRQNRDLTVLPDFCPDPALVGGQD
jgi:hypothetical protein